MKRIARPDIYWPLLTVVGLLAAFGLLNLYSALHLWGGRAPLKLFWWQLVWTLGGGCAMAWLARYDYRLLLRSTARWVAATVLFLVAVLLLGRVVGGNRNWLGVGGFGVQPSELAKLVIIFVLAKYFTERASPRGYHLAELVRPLGVIGLIMTLILLGGDMGSTVFLALLAGSMLAFAKLRYRSVILLLALVVGGAVIGYAHLMTPAQQARVTSFLHPEADPRGRGYQVLQAKIAIGSGQLWGRGYLQGSINKLRYLPEKHTDFVFPVWAEEWGFAGSLVLLSCYFLLCSIGLRISRNAGDRFGGFLAGGIVFFLFWQIAINLGGVLGLLPLTGVTLPFFSYGGSHILVTFAAIGLLLSVHRRRYLF